MYIHVYTLQAPPLDLLEYRCYIAVGFVFFFVTACQERRDLAVSAQGVARLVARGKDGTRATPNVGK